MAIIKCKMCGGDMELTADKTIGTCEYCGTQMTLPKIDDDQRASAFNRGNHFRRIGEFDKALTVYESIVRENNADAEAHWCCALCRFGIEYVEDPATYEWIPTCHRASFDSFLEDVDYLAAVEHSNGITKRQYQKDAAKIAEVQKGILSTSQTEEPYDVFICYKESDENGERTHDSALAQDIYYQLTEQGRRVFFARITLEDVVGKQYEPYIFAALNSAKVMIVVGTKAEHLNAVWVKNEWSRFLVMMKNDRSKLLLPCYRNMDPYDMPEQLSVLQSYDMSKIGFIQDLTRGIAKVLDATKNVEPVSAQAPVVVPQSSNGGHVAALLDRGNMALEDGEWEKADGFFEEVLNQDARNAYAYLGKFLVKHKKPTLEKMVSDFLEQTTEAREEKLVACSRDREKENNIVAGYALDEYLSKKELAKLCVYNLEYTSLQSGRQEQLKQAEKFYAQDKDWQRATSFADETFKHMLDGAKERQLVAMRQRLEQARVQDMARVKEICEGYVAHLSSAENKAKALRVIAESNREQDLAKAERKLNQEYLEIVNLMEQAKNEFDYWRVEHAFKANKFNGYRDVAQRIEHCHNEAERLKEEREKTIEVKRAKKNKACQIIVAFILIAAVVALVVTQIIVPGNHYKTAEELLMTGQYDIAVEVFESIGNYKDAPDRVLATKYGKAENLFADGKYDAAAEVFESIGDYKDAPERVLATYYAKAENLFADGEYTAAAEMFKFIGDYKDAPERVLATYYAKAEKLFADGEYATAARTYELAEGYNELERNAKMVEAKIEVIKSKDVGNVVRFGHFEQDGYYSNGPEEIEWIVMEKSEGKAVLLSKHILKCMNFSYESKNWDTSDIKKWLSDEFECGAFSDEERTRIRTTSFGRVYLLSVPELTEYLGDLSTDQAKTKLVADTISQSIWISGLNWWWTRSYDKTDSIMCISESGHIETKQMDRTGGVRPAITIDIEG